jgi:2',3'-cyclic-nucleotide 2'-phosphodiesterase (5'-nucleotidase family)
MPRWKRSWLALFLLFCASAPGEVRPLTILHINDIHAHLSPSDQGLGGFAYLATVIRRERANCPECILLNAGDLVQGTPVSTIFHGLPVFEVANLLGFDAATLGNHDFDYGWMQARKFIETANYPMVSANVVGADNRLFAPQPYVVLNVNHLRVAVIGALTDDMRNLSTPKLMEEWHTIPVIATVRRYAAELKDKSDLIVLLGHLTGEEEKEFLESAPEIPVIVTGHLHNGLEREMTRDGRVLVRVKGYAEELGRLDLKVDTEKKAPVSWTWKRILIDASKIEPAADVAPLVKRWEDEVTARVDRPLAVSRKNFTHAEVKALIEQAMREETGADFAFMNLGGVRDELPEGQLLERHIWDIMPFDNLVVIAKVKGSDLPAVVLGGRKPDPGREYTLAATDFTAANQSAPSELRTTGLKFGDDVGLLRDLLIDWCRKKKVIE